MGETSYVRDNYSNLKPGRERVKRTSHQREGRSSLPQNCRWTYSAFINSGFWKRSTFTNLRLRELTKYPIMSSVSATGYINGATARESAALFRVKSTWAETQTARMHLIGTEIRQAITKELAECSTLSSDLYTERAAVKGMT